MMDYYMDGYLKSNFDKIKEVIKQDWDMIFVVDGYEGAGKSMFTQQCAKYLDPTLDISRVVFNPKDFKDAVMAAQQYQAVIYDEAYGGLSSKRALSQVNQSIVQMLTVIRKRNLYVFIVLPSFFDLDKYVALWRSRGLLHVYTGDDFKRGLFRFYNAARKKDMYVKGKKFYEYRIGKPNFHGRFYKKWIIPVNEYDDKKMRTSIQVEEKANKFKEDRDNIIRKLVEDGLTHRKIAEMCGLTRSRVTQILGDVVKVNG